MNQLFRVMTTAAVGLVIPGQSLHAQEDGARVTYQGHVESILRQSCTGCHNQQRARNGLRLDSYAGIMEGGSSGAAVVKGDPQGSLLFQVIAHTREPFMPLDGTKLAEASIESIRAWIAQGAPETTDDRSFVPEEATGMGLDPSRIADAGGAAVMPGELRSEPYWWTRRPNTIMALAAAPVAPLFAVAGYRQVLLYHAETLELMGVLDFPAGTIHSIRFSRDGSLLLATGGTGAAEGIVIGWDVARGERVLEIADDFDVILAADISEDHRYLAIGGPSGLVRVYRTSDGTVVHEIDKHTDWVTAVEFSPDGVLLGTGDRAGGVFLWESFSGREFHTLPSHNGEIASMTWRIDSVMLATAGHDGVIRVIETESGRERRSWQSHNGVLDLVFDRSGRVATCGRDRYARLFDETGNQQHQFGPMDDIATSIAVSHDGSRIVCGGWTGEVRVFATEDGSEIGRISANPPTGWMLAINKARGDVERLEVALPEAESDVRTSTDALDSAMLAANEARAAADAAHAAVRAAEEGARKAEQARSAARDVMSELETLIERAHADAAALNAELAAREATAAEADEVLKDAVEQAQAYRAEVARAEIALVGAQRTANALPDDADAIAAVARARNALERASEQSQLATRLLDGAIAIAEREAADVARARVRATAGSSGVQSLETQCATDLAAARQTIAQTTAILDSFAELQVDADRSAGASREAAGSLAQAEQSAMVVRARVEDLTAEITAARARLSAAIALWEEKRGVIERAGGRVDAARD